MAQGKYRRGCCLEGATIPKEVMRMVVETQTVISKFNLENLSFVIKENSVEFHGGGCSYLISSYGLVRSLKGTSIKSKELCIETNNMEATFIQEIIDGLHQYIQGISDTNEAFEKTIKDQKFRENNNLH